jgi:hypothetical protein
MDELLGVLSELRDVASDARQVDVEAALRKDLSRSTRCRSTSASMMTRLREISAFARQPQSRFPRK